MVPRRRREGRRARLDITPLIGSDRQIIQSYSAGKFRVSGEIYECPLIVFPDHVEEWRFAGDPAALVAEDFSQILESGQDVDVILFGGGAKAVFVKEAVRQTLRDQGMILESMDTGAACRTYNVLLTEGRRVAALVLPV